MRKKPRPQSLVSLSATAKSSASTSMIGTCTIEEDDGVAERAQEDGVLRQACDVGEAAEGEVHAAAGLEAHPERPDDRVDHEDAEQHQGRRDEEPAVDLLAALEFCLCQGMPRRSHAKPIAYRHAAASEGKGAGETSRPGSHLLDLLLDLCVDGRDGLVDRAALGEGRQLRDDRRVDLVGEDAVVRRPERQRASRRSSARPAGRRR